MLNFSFKQFTEVDIVEALNDLFILSSGGITDIPVSVLKMANKHATPILKEIFDFAISSGRIPDEWKVSYRYPII